MRRTVGKRDVTGPLRIGLLSGLALAAGLFGYERAEARRAVAEALAAAAAADAAEHAALPEAPADVAAPPPGPPAAAEAPVEPGAWDIANIDHPRVDYWIGRFQTDRRHVMEGALQRRGRYAPYIVKALEQRGLPRDLVYLAMIESAFDPTAYSRAHASGIWQFIQETGRRYGLEVNPAVDERRDFVKATDAALRYLSDLHGRFGSWYLAAAAYNTGENRVARILRQTTGRTRGGDADFYRMWDRLPAETRDYVPLMIAAGRIVKDPARHGFEGVQALAAFEYDEVVAPPATSLTDLAGRAGVTVAAVRELNPHLRLDRTRADEPMVVRLPRVAASAPEAAD